MMRVLPVGRGVKWGEEDGGEMSGGGEKKKKKIKEPRKRGRKLLDAHPYTGRVKNMIVSDTPTTPTSSCMLYVWNIVNRRLR